MFDHLAEKFKQFYALKEYKMKAFETKKQQFADSFYFLLFSICQQSFLYSQKSKKYTIKIFKKCTNSFNIF